MLPLQCQAGKQPLSHTRKQQESKGQGDPDRFPLSESFSCQVLKTSVLGGVLGGGMLVLRCLLLPWGGAKQPGWVQGHRSLKSPFHGGPGDWEVIRDFPLR